MAKQADYDVFIIGGGINGAGIACDASGRGLNVGLCEMNDLASATSSSSSKLIHGGLRYLETYQFRLVREALAEREVLLKKAPHIISPLRFRLPHHPRLRPRWMIRLGLFLYDYLSKRTTLAASKSVLLDKSEGFIDSLTHGFEYSDGWVDDARLVVLNAIAARDSGADIMTYCRCINVQRRSNDWRIQLQPRGGGDAYWVTAKSLINAAGPWVEHFYTEVLQRPCPKTMRLVKGSHIVVPRINASDKAYILQNKDGRIVFVIPYQTNFSLVGTTDVDYRGDLAQVTISPEEIDYLITSVAGYFKQRINTADIISDFAGVRPLFSDDNSAAEQAASVSRDYSFDIDYSHDQAPLVSVFGGKITTYRKLSEAVVDSLVDFFPAMKPSRTASEVLPGGDIGNIADYQHSLRQRYSHLPQSLLLRYSQLYGCHLERFVQPMDTLESLGLDFGAGLYQREVDYLCRYEWAITVDDILQRRTKLGLVIEDTSALADYLRHNHCTGKVKADS